MFVVRLTDSPVHHTTTSQQQVAKARDYFLAKIAELRRPKTHVQMVQRHGLMKYQYLMEFLAQNAPEVAEEVRAS